MESHHQARDTAPHYPYPPPVCMDSKQSSQLEVKPTAATDNWKITADGIMEEFPSVFNGQIRIMEGEKFHITLVDNATPFCVKAPNAHGLSRLPAPHADCRKLD